MSTVSGINLPPPIGLKRDKSKKEGGRISPICTSKDHTSKLAINVCLMCGHENGLLRWDERANEGVYFSFSAAEVVATDFKTTDDETTDDEATDDETADDEARDDETTDDEARDDQTTEGWAN